mgnify:CR=1 FL=1
MDKLTEIMDAKRREIAPFARPVTDEELAAFALRRLPTGFRASLETPGRLTVIAVVSVLVLLAVNARSAAASSAINATLSRGAAARYTSWWVLV